MGLVVSCFFADFCVHLNQVEPSELSLDLAKMSREIRGSPDVLFAREVAR